MKIFIVLSVFFASFALNASVENVCPPIITCDYQSGVCDMPNNNPFPWFLDASGAAEDFFGKDSISLSKIRGSKNLNDSYGSNGLMCDYSYGNNSVITISTLVNVLIGDNWVFSGFGKSKAECSDVSDPTKCAGIVY